MGIGAVKVVSLYEDVKIPERQSDYAAGFDLRAHNIATEDKKNRFLEEPFELKSGKTVIFGTGLILEIPAGYEMQIRPRSGLAKKNISIMNSPGTIDADYRGEVGIMLCNLDKKPFFIEKGARIAQAMFFKIEIPTFTIVNSVSQLSNTTRGEGGFGSTGLFNEGFGTSAYDQEIVKTDRYLMGVTIEVAKLSNCIRGCKRDKKGDFPRDKDGYFVGQTRRFGCVIAKGYKIISSGFNCQYPGSSLCSEVGCLRDELGIKSGEQIESCRALHAEQMAIGEAVGSGESLRDSTMYVNSEPCRICSKMIAGLRLKGLNTLVILKGQYPNHGLNIVREAGISVREIEL